MTDQELIDRLIRHGYSVSVRCTESDSNDFNVKYKVYKIYRICEDVITYNFSVDKLGNVKE